MEMIKQQDKSLRLLEQARQELAAFNRKGVAVPQAPSMNAGITTSGPSHGDRILYCSKVPQASAVLILKLQETGAEITDVIARRKTSATAPGAAQAVRNELVMRELLQGNYRGCPHCDNASLVLCTGCGNLSCIADDADTLFCPVCAHTGRVVRTSINLDFSRQKATQQTLLPKGARPLALPRKS